MVMRLFKCEACDAEAKALAAEVWHPCPKNSLSKLKKMTLVCEKHKIESDGAGHRACLSCRRTK